jgi:WXG100 family type VII secretion target
MSQPGGTFQNTDTAMNTGITSLETAVSDCNRIYNTVMDTVTGLPQSWNGEAASAYQNLMASWQDDFTKVVAALQALHDNLVVNKQTYDSMEQQNIQTASSR